jgi:hypothetical protein
MILLTSVSDLLQVINGTTGSISVHASWTDLNSGTVTPGRTNSLFTTAATNTVVASPASSTQRNVQMLTVRNTHATITTLITIQHTDGTNVVVLYVVTLAPGQQCIYDGQDFVSYDIYGNILAAAQATAQGSDKQVQFNNVGFTAGDANFTWDTTQRIITLGGVSSEPSAPSSGLLAIYSRLVTGRMLPQIKGPSGLSTRLQPAFFGNTISLWTPLTSTTVTGGFGATWSKGGSSGTVATPTPASTNFISAMRRTTHGNVVTTTNQAMGIINTASGSPNMWRGNGSGLGGFFFFARFGLATWAAGARLFVGVTPGAAEVVTSDTFANNSCGFWIATTDSGNTIWFNTKDGSTVNQTSISGATIASNSCFDAYIYCKPNDTTVYFRLDQIDSGAPVTLIDSSIAVNLPGNTTFLGAQVEASNGTANTTANTVVIAVNKIYTETDQ